MGRVVGLRRLDRCGFDNGLVGLLGLRRRSLGGGALRGTGTQADLDARGRGAEAVVALVARAPAVFADQDLGAALVRKHGRRDLVLTEQHDGLEALALVGRQAVHDESLAVADAVLLVPELDDRVVHGVETRAWKPATAKV